MVSRSWQQKRGGMAPVAGRRLWDLDVLLVFHMEEFGIATGISDLNPMHLMMTQNSYPDVGRD